MPNVRAGLAAAVARQWRDNVLTDCGTPAVESYVQDVYEDLLRKLPVLVFGLLKARLFNVNWYEVLGLEMLASVRRTARAAHAVAEDIKAHVKQNGGTLDDALNVHKALEPLIKELKAPEAAVRRLTEEVAACRRGEASAARAEAEGLRRDMSTAKRALTEQRELHRNDVAKLKTERDRAMQRFDDEVSGASEERDAMRDERDMLKVEVTKFRVAAAKAAEEATAANHRANVLQDKLAAAEALIERNSKTNQPSWANVPEEQHRKVALERQLENNLKANAGGGVDIRRTKIKGADANTLVGLALEEMAVVSSERHSNRIYLFGGGFASDSGDRYDGAIGAGDFTHGETTLGMRAFVLDVSTGIVDEVVSQGEVPPPRTHATAIVLSDPKDVREMDGLDEAATLNALNGPCPDGGRETVLVFGGQDEKGWVNDAYLYDPNERIWHKLSEGSPFGGRIAAVAAPARQRNATVLLSREWDASAGSLSPMAGATAFTIAAKSPGDPRVQKAKQRMATMRQEFDDALARERKKRAAERRDSVVMKIPSAPSRRPSTSGAASPPPPPPQEPKTRPLPPRMPSPSPAPAAETPPPPRAGSTEPSTPATEKPKATRRSMPMPARPASSGVRMADLLPQPSPPPTIEDVELRDDPSDALRPLATPPPKIATTRIIKRHVDAAPPTPAPKLTPRRGEALANLALPSLPAVAPTRWRQGRDDGRDDPAARYYAAPAMPSAATIAASDHAVTALKPWDLPRDAAMRLTHLYASTGPSFDAHAAAMGLDAAAIYELAAARERGSPVGLRPHSASPSKQELLMDAGVELARFGSTYIDDKFLSEGSSAVSFETHLRGRR